MAIFMTGATGYLGSYVAQEFLRNSQEPLALLVRAESRHVAAQRLWRALQLHMDFEEFETFVHGRVQIFLGDITEPRLGLSTADYHQLVRMTNSVVHIAASLNRRSEKSCMNVNLRGTLAVAKLAYAAHTHHGLRRFSEVSTTAVAGRRNSETVFEDRAIEWDRSDYDPYARSKKFCEHLLHEALPGVPVTIFRPSIVLGDSRMAATTQFDMLRAFAFLARLPVIPVPRKTRLDIVPADYVGRAIAHVHLLDRPEHRIYHLSAGAHSQTAEEIMAGLRLFGKPLSGRLLGMMAQPTGQLSAALAITPRRFGLSGPASLLKVFWPYITFNTVFDNSRIVSAVGAPPRCTEYMSPVLEFGIRHNFTYPYKPWPMEARRLGVGGSLSLR